MTKQQVNYKQTKIGEVPKDWDVCKLGDKIETLTDYHANGSYKSLKQNVQLKDKPDYAVMIRTTNFEQNDFKGNFKYIDKNAYEFLSKSKVYPEDILMNKIANAGVVYLMPNLDVPVSLAMNLFLIRINRSTEQKYVYYYLKAFETLVKSYARGTAAKTINKSSVREIPIALPKLGEQRRIATILTSIDKKIELNGKMNKTLEEMGKAFFKHWFVDFEFPNKKGKPYKSSGGEMVNSELGEIPKDWRFERLNELIDVFSGFAFSSSIFDDNGIYGLVTIKNVQDGKFKNLCANRISTTPKKMPSYCRLESGDVLLSLTGNVGRVCYVYGDNLLLNQRVAKLSPKNQADIAFTYFLFRQRAFKNKLIGISRGTAQQNLSPVETSQLQIFIPPREILDSFSNRFSALYEFMIDNSNQSVNLIQIRDSLLPRLMSGRIRVEV